jgi:hypothetical protein
MPAFDAEFGELIVADEAIALPAAPAVAVRDLSAATRARSTGSSVRTGPGGSGPYRPHVSVAYLTANGSAAPYVNPVKAANPEPARVRISQVDLVEMHRDRWMYEWTIVAGFRLANGRVQQIRTDDPEGGWGASGSE